MDKWIGKIRPQIFLAILALAIIAWIAILNDLNDIASGCVIGIVALSKDVIQSDSDVAK